MEAQRKLNGLGLPRQWKVMTSTLLLLFTFAIGNVWGAAPSALTYQTISSTTIIYTSPTNLAALGYVQDGKGTQTYSVPSSDRGNGLNPTDETKTDYAIGTNATTLKSVESNKSVYFYVKNVTKVEAYVKNNSSGDGKDRTTTIVATPTSGSALDGSVTLNGASGKAVVDGLDKDKNYTIVIHANGADMFLYAVRLTAATLTPTAPAITSPASDPDLQTITQGETKTFEVTATGYPAPTYKWYRNSSKSTTGATEIEGATAESYTTPNTLAASANNYYFYCVATNASGTAQSPYFSLKVNELGADLTVHTPGVYEKATDQGGWGRTMATYEVDEIERQFEIIAMTKNNSKNYWFAGTKTSTTSDAHCLSTEGFTTSFTPANITGAWMKGTFSALGSNTSSALAEFPAISSYCSAKITTAAATSVMIKVQGYDQISFYAKDANATASNNQHLVVKIDGVEQSMTLNTSYSVRRFTLDASKTSVVEITGSSASGESHLVGFSLRIPTCTKPAAPTALSCTAQTVNTLTFGWTKETNATGYVATLYSDSECETEVESKNLGDVATVTFTGLSASTNYWCKVQSKGNGTTYCAEGGVTSAAQGTTATPSCGVVTPPTFLQAGSITAEGATLLVTDAADAMNYEFYISEESTEPETSATATHTSTTKEKAITGLTSGTTYYVWVRSVCDADHKSIWVAANKSFKVRTNPTASFANANYFIGASAIDVSANFTSNSEAAVVYELKESYPNVTLSGSSFSATVAGAYVVVANQAGNSDYMPISKEATITVLPALTYLIENRLNIANGDPWVSNIYTKDDSKITNLSAFNPSRTGDGAINVNKKTANGSRSSNISSYDTENAENYMVLAFKVADGYALNVSAISVQAFSVGNEKQHRAWITDADGNMLVEGTKTLAQNACENVFGDVDFSSTSVSLTGVNYLKLWTWGNTDGYRLNTPIYIDGEIVSTTPIAPAITAPTTDQTAEYDLNDVITPLEVTATGYPAPTYQWYYNSSASTEGATSLGSGAQTASYTPANDAASDLYYYCVATNAKGSATSPYFHVTVNAPTVPTIYTETTAMSLVSNKVATDSKKFTFSGINLDVTPVTLVLASEVDGLTLSTSSVTPTAGSIADTEITVSYKSVVDVAEANVNLYLKHGDDILHTIVLTYSSTAGVENLTPISAATTWNWDGANSSTEAIESLDADNIVVFANYSGWDESFKANSLAGRLQYVYRGSNYAQGHSLKFNTTVPGMVTVSFSNTSTKEVARAPRITDTNGSYAPTDEADGAKTADAKSYSHAVAAGDVLIEGFEMQEGTPANMLRFYEVRFVPTFSVTYMPNGGSGAEFIVDDAATQVRAGSIFTAPASSAFVAWNTQADGNGDTYLPGAAVTADLTLHAQWETSYTVTFDLQGHGAAIDPQNIVSGGKVVKPADPSESGWDFGGWYKENTCTNAWDFATDVVTTTTTIFAKWTEDPCPTPFSLSKVVLTSASDGTVTGYNGNEYAGEKVIGGLKDDDQTAEVDPSHEGVEEGYKLNNGGSGIVFATLKKGTFQEGDRVVVTITKKQDAYKVEEVSQPILDIYYGTDKNDATFLTTLEGVSAAGTYTYRLTAADVTAIGTKKGIGVFRPSSGRTQNPYVYSVEIQGCREWAIFHTLTFKNIDGTATIAAESLEEGAYASTVAPAAPKIATKRFLGWAEAIDGTPVELTSYTITENKTLYAVYEDIVCPTSGTVYKFQLKTDLTNGNVFATAPNSVQATTDNYLSELVGGEVTFSVTGTNNNRIQFYDQKAVGFASGSGGQITMTLECPLKENDEIRFINYASSGNRMTLSDGTNSTTLDGNGKTDVQTFVVPAAWETTGSYELTLVRNNNTPKLTYFEIYRRPEVTGVTIADFTIREGASTIPTMTLSPSDDARVTSQAWSILSGNDKITISPTTGEVTGVAQGDAEIKVVLNGIPAMSATATVHVVETFVQEDVTESITWDFSKAGATSQFNEQVLANVDGVTLDASQFDGRKLVGSAQNITSPYLQGTMLTFNTTVKGLLSVRFTSGNNNPRVLKVYVGDPEVEIASWNYSGAATENKSIEVPAGKVTLRSYQGENPNNVRILRMAFQTPDHVRTEMLGNGVLGTICVPNNVPISQAFGATFYELVGREPQYGKIAFDEITFGELTAGKPYVFQAHGDNLVLYYGTTHVDDPVNGYGMYGTFEAITLPDDVPAIENLNDIYYFAQGALWSCVDLTSLSVPANRAYVKLSEIPDVPTQQPAPGRRRITLGVQGEQVATGIENGELNEAPRKVLINGELFIIRGEKMYDAKGQLVK